MVPGCLLITNNVAAAHEAEFNDWYQDEHLDDRLGVPGFLTARRYRAIDSPQRYAAVYETRSSDVLLSPDYAALLRAPSPRTRAIMPAFQDVTRIIGDVAAGRKRGAGSVLALLFLVAPQVDAARIRQLATVAEGVTCQGLTPESVRAVWVIPDSVGVDTPESRIRPTPDRRADVVLLVEWIEAGGETLHALRTAVQAAGWPVETDRGGLYRLICHRGNGTG